MNKKEKQVDGQSFTETVEKKIQEVLTKSKEEKSINTPKPKSGKGL